MKRIWSGAAFIMYTAGGGGGGKGAVEILEWGKIFSHPPSWPEEKRRKKFLLDVNQRSFLKICCQLDGNLHVITFDYRTVLDV